MLQKIKHLFAVLLLAGFAAQPALAESFSQDDMAFAFGNSAASSDLGDMALLSNQEMMETEGEFWPLVYGAAWGVARASIWAAGRYGSRWGYRAVTSSNNHRILLRNNRHVLQTGGYRGVSGFGQRASHIGWGTSSRGNFSNRHLFYNSRYTIR